jgi:hypothetical protein
MQLRSAYQRFAKDCLDMAKRADPNARDTLHQMAETWLSLAADELTKAGSTQKDTHPQPDV